MGTLKGVVGGFVIIMQLHYPNVCVCQFHYGIPYHPSFAGRMKSGGTVGNPCEANVIYFSPNGSRTMTRKKLEVWFCSCYASQS